MHPAFQQLSFFLLAGALLDLCLVRIKSFGILHKVKRFFAATKHLAARPPEFEDVAFSSSAPLRAVRGTCCGTCTKQRKKQRRQLCKADTVEVVTVVERGALVGRRGGSLVPVPLQRAALKPWYSTTNQLPAFLLCFRFLQPPGQD